MDFPKAYTNQVREQRVVYVWFAESISGDKIGNGRIVSCVDLGLVVLPHLVLRVLDHLEVPIA